MFNKYIENYKTEIIQKIQELIQIPSILSNSANANHPFGDEINDALEYMLNLGKSLGFRTKNIDAYCGYIEFGEGQEIIGIIGHLDVVPANDKWTYPPFSGTIHNNKIYGRSVIDDKGSCICSIVITSLLMLFLLCFF